MKAGIIAAGEGSRLKSEGVPGPKPLVRVGGMTLLERLLSTFHRCGIREVHCIINEESTEIRDYTDRLGLPLKVSFLVKSTPSSMHSLFELSPYLSDGPFLLSTVDSIFDEDELRSFLARSAAIPPADGVLAVTSFVDDENPLYVRTAEDGSVLSFSKTERAPVVTGGLYLFSPRIFTEIPAAGRAGMERLRNFLAHLIASGYRFETFPFSKIVDIDHARDIAVAEAMLGGD